ncbi:MAG: hypothetical protein JJU05_18365 [Verrucomicrobia bacterium]|nr:hypothetical protein [Verrucomicrobiota bacterium]MCH8529113.1 hypothetical protein [Kiritimatiellia bacterium]
MKKAGDGLWWTCARREALRSALAEGNLSARFLEEQTRARAVPGEDEEDGGRGLEPRAVLAWLEKDTAMAESVVRDWTAFSGKEPSSNLGEAGWALTGAVILDVAGDMVSDAVRREAAEALWHLVASLRVPTRGNPHVVTNNWWAVTHGGALCAALAAERAAGRDCPGYDAEAAPWALGRLRAFCHHFGPTGLYHEGLGYIRYTCIFLFSAILAAKARGLGDLLEDFPNLRMTVPSLYAATALRRYEDDSAGADERFGASLSWNDMGTGAGVSLVDHIGLAISPEAHRASLKAWFDKLSGPDSPCPSLGGHHGCIPMAWAFYPLDGNPKSECSLPREVVDSRQGLWFWRNRYRDADDVVFGLYAKATHGGGHAHRDAGSLRLEAFGTDWIAGPGQARTGREGQTVAYPASGEEPPVNLGAFHFQEPHEDGPLAGMELRRTSGCYHERFAALKTDPGGEIPLALALADFVDDHIERDWIWNWTFPRELHAELDADGAGVKLCRADGTAVWLRFLETKPVSLDLQELPESRRTFASGKKVSYRGKPYIHAVFAPEKHLAIAVAAVWGSVSTLKAPGGGVHGIDLGGNLRWDRPFGAAVPPGFVAGRSAGPAQHSGKGG